MPHAQAAGAVVAAGALSVAVPRSSQPLSMLASLSERTTRKPAVVGRTSVMCDKSKGLQSDDVEIEMFQSYYGSSARTFGRKWESVQQCCRVVTARQAAPHHLAGREIRSFSAVSAPIFASKYAFFSFFSIFEIYKIG